MVTRYFFGLAVAAAMLVAPVVSASTLETLHKFTGVGDGETPYGGLVSDKAGILYGVTAYGGNFNNTYCGTGCGTIFSIDPASGKFTTIHKFTDMEGVALSGPLVYRGGGIFYGAAGYGGPGVTSGGGTIFSFDASTKKVRVLFTLTGAKGGLTCPVTGLVLAQGGLYGQAFCGGPGNFGGIYRYDLAAKTFKVVYAYNGSLGCRPCGEYPTNNMVLGQDGMIYGTSTSGSTYSRGALFKIDPSTNKATEVHAFNPDEGGTISGILTVGPDGMLYGTAAQGSTAKGNCGGTGCGAVFKFDPVTLNFTVLHYFTGKADGGFPEGVTVIGPSGNYLFGETGFGGAHHRGTLYRVDVTSGQLTVEHAFSGGADGAMGEYHLSGLSLYKGKFYGSTSGGGLSNVPDCGTDGCGTIFSFTP